MMAIWRALLPAPHRPTAERQTIETLTYNPLFVALKGRVSATASVESTDKPAELTVKALPMSIEEPGIVLPGTDRSAPVWRLSDSPTFTSVDTE
jgi:hypothetical protein